MRLTTIILAMTSLGLAAVGVVSAQKMIAASGSSAASSKTLVVLPSQNAPARPLVSQIAEATPPGAQAAGAAGATSTRVAQTTTAPVTATPNGQSPNSSAQGNTKPALAAGNIPPCDKPAGMGLSRIIEIDTTGGPGFGFEHFKQYDFLRDKEIVLTFDDGPWPANTPAVIKALADEKAEQEIEMGNSAVHMAAAGAPVAPFFRFPDLQHPPQLLEYLGQRNIAIFSTDIDSRDFKMHKPDEVIKSVMSQLEKRGKGIILMHDFQKNTAEALPELVRQLKAGGYKVVHMVPRGQLTTIPRYDEMVSHQDKLSSNNTRPENSVVHTIGE